MSGNSASVALGADAATRAADTRRMEQRNGAQPVFSSRVPWALLLCLQFSAGWGERCVDTLGAAETRAHQLQLLGCPGKGFFCSSHMVSLQQPQSEGGLMRSSLSVGGCVGEQVGEP